MIESSHSEDDLWESKEENPRFLSEQIITYLGNKRALLSFIGDAVDVVKQELHREKLKLFDVFSGSGIVSRYFKRHASVLYANDLENYSKCLNDCYLSNRSGIDSEYLSETLAVLKTVIENNLHPGLVTELYAPQEDADIKPGERVFYTNRNARYIDTAREEISKLPAEYQKFFLAPLLYGASVHNNTSGVFKGFYKNKEGIGQFGGTGKNALKRILGSIELEMPVFSNFDCECHVCQGDAYATACKITEDLDLAYLDPPYNQHPYGSNYFMLNLILNYKKPDDISSVSGIPTTWNRSPYNKNEHAQNELFKLVRNINSKYILISYNSEGFVQYDAFVEFLTSLGQLKVMSTDYNTFRGCRNLGERNIYVKEYLFLLKRS